VTRGGLFPIFAASLLSFVRVGILAAIYPASEDLPSLIAVLIPMQAAVSADAALTVVSGVVVLIRNVRETPSPKLLSRQWWTKADVGALASFANRRSLP